MDLLPAVFPLRAFAVLLLVSLPFLVVAPRRIAGGIWVGGMSWLYLSAATTVVFGGFSHQVLVIFQMLLWLLTGSVIVVRSLIEDHDDGLLLLIEVIAVLGSLTESDPDPPQPPGQQPGHAAHPPWQQGGQGNTGTNPEGGQDNGDTDVFGGLDLDTDPLHDDT